MGQQLLEGLVGEHVKLYQTNPLFRSAVISLASMLPVWVDGLAIESEKQSDKLALLEKYYNGEPNGQVN